MDDDGQTLTLNAHFTFGEIHIHVHTGPAVGDVQTILAELSRINNTMADETLSLSNLTAQMATLEASETAEAAELAKVVGELQSNNTDNNPAINALALRVGKVAAALDAAGAGAVAGDPNTPKTLTVTLDTSVATAGANFAGKITVTGGSGSYTITDAGFSPAAPVTMDPQGQYSGIFPAGTFTDTVTAVDANNPAISGTLAVSVVAS